MRTRSFVDCASYKIILILPLCIFLYTADLWPQLKAANTENFQASNIFLLKEDSLSLYNKIKKNNLVRLKIRRGLFNPSASYLINEVMNENSLPSLGTKNYLLKDGTTWRDNDSLIGMRLYGILGAVTLVDLAGYQRLKELWYDWPTTSFHAINFADDFEKYKWMDKMGHFLHAYFASNLFSRGYRWAGLEGNKSVWYGALSGWLWMLQIEIADGFFTEWGFSWGDLIANSAGSGFSLLQQLYPDEFGGIQPKISYRRSKALKEDRYNNNAKSIIDDYEGMTFWLTVNVYHYLPKKIQEQCPQWLAPLGIAIGHSAKGIANHPQGGVREIFLGLDFDLRKIPLDDESEIVRFLKSELNIIRLPLPAVKLTPNGVWYGLYF
jgi:hypothetical protein